MTDYGPKKPENDNRLFCSVERIIRDRFSIYIPI